ncbi:MAG: hypothetical protein HW389_1538, partial [Bacteroidetes bacterium]|nr:hypothetical protein [Bacteroidota bacterium]
MDVNSNPGQAQQGRPRRSPLVGNAMMLLVPVVLLLSITLTSLSQEALRPSMLRLKDSLRVTSLSFNRVLNTYTWNGTTFYDREFNGIDVMLRQLVRSRLIRTDQQSNQDEYDDSLVVGMEIAEHWKARLRTS